MHYPFIHFYLFEHGPNQNLENQANWNHSFSLCSDSFHVSVGNPMQPIVLSYHSGVWDHAFPHCAVTFVALVFLAKQESVEP